MYRNVYLFLLQNTVSDLLNCYIPQSLLKRILIFKHMNGDNLSLYLINQN